MGDVVNLGKPERLIWVCACGCNSFNLLSDGVAECCKCRSPVIGAEQGWQDVTEDAGKREDSVQQSSDIQFNGSADFALHHIRKRAADPDVKLVIVATGDSRTSIWAEAQTVPEKKWTEDRVADAMQLFNSWEFDQ